MTGAEVGKVCSDCTSASELEGTTLTFVPCPGPVESTVSTTVIENGEPRQASMVIKTCGRKAMQAIELEEARRGLSAQDVLKTTVWDE